MERKKKAGPSVRRGRGRDYLRQLVARASSGADSDTCPPKMTVVEVRAGGAPNRLGDPVRPTPF